MSSALRFKTSGYSATDDLGVDPGISKTKDITDGVAFWHDREGGWLIRYTDLVAIVEAATEARRAKQPARIETREVLAACYLGPNKQSGRMLSHACEVSADGVVRKVLCGRVSELSMADRGASDPKAPPTCERCQRALRRAK